jgi:SAM-dependent methyltransferase
MRLHAPATQRNRLPIAQALAAWLPAEAQAGGRVLEVASGTGEHALYFAASFPGVIWQPSDPEPAHRASIAAYRADHLAAGGRDNLAPPLDLDATQDDWLGLSRPLDAPVDAPFDAVVCCNMIHIAPWAAAEGLVAGAARVLKPGGGLFLYGPFKRAGAHTAPSNEAFDASLRARNPAWGLRDLEAVAGLAAEAGFAAPQVAELPANNLAVWFVKQA